MAGDGGFERDGSDLAEGVNAGVGAAGALGEDGLAGDVEEGVGERSLDGREAGLNLPAVVGRAVVGEGELPVRHGTICTVTERWGEQRGSGPDWNR